MSKLEFTKECLLCKREFYVDTYGKRTRQHCSRICAYKSPLRSKKLREHSPNKKGVRLNTGRTHFKKGHIPANKGVKGFRHSGSFKKGHAPLWRPVGKLNWSWAGDNVKYRGIHTWLAKYYGKSYQCENLSCEKKSNNFHWAKLKNKEYERKRENFWMLCVSCHMKYDKSK